MTMAIRVCVAGATGWAGSSLSEGIHRASDMELVGAVSRSSAGKTLGDVIDVSELQTVVSGSAEEALETNCDVFFEYTKPDVAKSNILHALEAGCHVVVGTSGLDDGDFQEISKAAELANRGVLAVGNFALTVVLLQKFSEMAAKHIPSWEIIDYASSKKRDAPSGTTRELAHRLGQVRESQLEVPIDETVGPKESRGLRQDGTQIHSVRLPGYVISAEVIFGMPDQKLVLRHEAGSSAEPYVEGALLAIRKVGSFTGLRRGLDTVMDF